MKSEFQVFVFEGDALVAESAEESSSRIFRRVQLEDSVDAFE